MCCGFCWFLAFSVICFRLVFIGSFFFLFFFLFLFFSFFSILFLFFFFLPVVLLVRYGFCGSLGGIVGLSPSFCGFYRRRPSFFHQFLACVCQFVGITRTLRGSCGCSPPCFSFLVFLLLLFCFVKSRGGFFADALFTLNAHLFTRMYDEIVVRDRVR